MDPESGDQLSELKPKLKRDWEGRLVKTLVQVETKGGDIFPAGLIMEVHRNRGGLSLSYVTACLKCRLKHRDFIKGVREFEVELLREGSKNDS